MKKNQKNTEKSKNLISVSLKHEKILIFSICVCFNIIAVLLSRNEVFLDDWYIEASADGLFGNNNRSLVVVGTNYLFTFIIYLLSLTGLRLFWFHILLVIMNTISSFMVCTYISEKIQKKYKYLFCIMYLILITPFVSFYFQFTTTAAYVVSVGCLWIFRAIEENKSKKSYLYGGFWIVLGGLVRMDCIYFSVFFMGLVWLIKVFKTLSKNKKENYFKLLVKYTVPFLVSLITLIGLEISQQVIMEYKHPGFREWNVTRSYVDDYALPDYIQNIKKYKEIGVSYNDYQLLKSWNNIDSDFFTEDLYQKLQEIKDNSRNEVVTNNGFIGFILQTIGNMASNVVFWYLILCLLFFLIIFDFQLFFETCILFIGMIVLSTYFSYRGRLIWRTEWPIWIALIIAFLIIALNETIINRIRHHRYINRTFFLFVFILLFLFWKPVLHSNGQWNIYAGKSLYTIYKERIQSPDTYGKFIFAKIGGKETIQYDTFDGEISECLENNKDKFYFRLWTRDWLQQYPLTDRDIFRTAPLGAGENWGSLGQYIINLEPLQNNMKSYGIDNPFKSLVNDNVRVVVKEQELRDRTLEIERYLKEHYYEEVDFSVEEILDNAIVGRYLQPMDVCNMKKVEGNITTYFKNYSDYQGMGRILLDGLETVAFDPDTDEAFLQITSSVGDKHIFTLMKNDEGNMQALIYWDTLLRGESYDIQFIFRHENGWKYIEGKEKLKIKSLLEEYSTNNLDFSHVQTLNENSTQGFYYCENGYAWTNEYSSVNLYNEHITENGLNLKLYTWDYSEEGTEPIKILVNGVCVYEMDVNGGMHDIKIPAKKIANQDHRYFVEIVCPYHVNPALQLGLPDDRNLSVRVSYIGNIWEEE